jgi:hypothetical protein
MDTDSYPVNVSCGGRNDCLWVRQGLRPCSEHAAREYAVPQDERECTCALNRRSRECEMHGDHKRDSRRGTISHRDIADAQRRSFGDDGSDAAEGRAARDEISAWRAARTRNDSDHLWDAATWFDCEQAASDEQRDMFDEWSSVMKRAAGLRGRVSSMESAIDTWEKWERVARPVLEAAVRRRIAWLKDDNDAENIAADKAEDAAVDAYMEAFDA